MKYAGLRIEFYEKKKKKERDFSQLFFIVHRTRNNGTNDLSNMGSFPMFNGKLGTTRVALQCRS